MLLNRDLTTDQKNALKMFDSNGAFPFFQEGILRDATIIDICSFIPTIPGCQSLPSTLRVVH